MAVAYRSSTAHVPRLGGVGAHRLELAPSLQPDLGRCSSGSIIDAACLTDLSNYVKPEALVSIRRPVWAERGFLACASVRK